MIRRAFTMRLKPDALTQYKHHYDNIWPELVAQIERSGIASITTFQRDLDLFLVSEIADEAAWDTLWNSEVYKRWTAVMEPLMYVRADGIIESGELTEVFHITTNGNGRSAAPDVVMAQRPDEAMPERVSEVPAETSMADSAPPPVKMPAAEPAPKTRANRAKKQAVKKPSRKKAAPAKKAKGKAAKRPKVRAAAKRVKKSRKKAAGKTSAPKKAKTAPRKKRAAKKRR